MSYSAVNTARADAAQTGAINMALVKKAALRVVAIISTDDQREYGVCKAILDGTQPASWLTIVLEVLDINGALVSPTDTAIDTAVTTAWTYFIKSRS